MKAILIDPYKKMVTFTNYSGKFEGPHGAYELIGCTTIGAPVNYPNGDVMYCDEEAWFTANGKAKLCGFAFHGYKYAILGKALIVGSDNDGNDTDVKSTYEDLKEPIWFNDNQMTLQGLEMGLL